MSSVLGIAVVLALVAALFVVVRAIHKRYALHPEWTRKLLHVGSGLIALSFPWLFPSSWPVVTVCALSAFWVLLLRRSERLRALHKLLGDVNRSSGGDMYFPLAVALIFLLAAGDPLLYEVPVLILTFADTAAATMGVRYGKTHYRTLHGRKTLEGSLSFWVVAFFCTFVPLVLATDVGFYRGLMIGLLVGFASMIIEAVGTRGLDNLLIPLYAFLVLKSSLARDDAAVLLEMAVAPGLAVSMAVLCGGLVASSKRIWRYFREMLPLPQHLGLAVFIYVGIAVYARRIHELPTSLLSPYGAAGAWTLFNLLVVLRLMDELKDEDIDRELFPQRPLPSGRVLRTDIRWALLGAAALYLAVNLWMGWVFYVATCVLGYAFLMFHRFFAPALLRRSLPLTLVTHNPIVALMILYGFTVFAAEHSLTPGDLRWDLIVPFVFMVWSPFLAWELSRKIRCKEEETEYVTYSRILGQTRAVVVTWLVQGIGLSMGLYLWMVLNFHWAYAAVITAAFAVNVWAGLRFLRHPSARTSRLHPFASLFLVAVLTSQIIGCGIPFDRRARGMQPKMEGAEGGDSIVSLRSRS